MDSLHEMKNAVDALIQSANEHMTEELAKHNFKSANQYSSVTAKLIEVYEILDNEAIFPGGR